MRSQLLTPAPTTSGAPQSPPFLQSFPLPASCLRRMLDQVSTPEGLQGGLNAPYAPYPTPSPAYSQLTNFCISVTWVSVGEASESRLRTKEFKILATAREGTVHVRALRDG